MTSQRCVQVHYEHTVRQRVARPGRRMRRVCTGAVRASSAMSGVGPVRGKTALRLCVGRIKLLKNKKGMVGCCGLTSA